MGACFLLIIERRSVSLSLDRRDSHGRSVLCQVQVKKRDEERQRSSYEGKRRRYAQGNEGLMYNLWHNNVQDYAKQEVMFLSYFIFFIIGPDTVSSTE